MLGFSYHVKILSGRLAFYNEDNLKFNVGIADIVEFYFSLQALWTNARVLRTGAEVSPGQSAEGDLGTFSHRGY